MILWSSDKELARFFEQSPGSAVDGWNRQAAQHRSTIRREPGIGAVLSKSQVRRVRCDGDVDGLRAIAVMLVLSGIMFALINPAEQLIPDTEVPQNATA